MSVANVTRNVWGGHWLALARLCVALLSIAGLTACGGAQQEANYPQAPSGRAETSAQGAPASALASFDEGSFEEENTVEWSKSEDQDHALSDAPALAAGSPPPPPATQPAPVPDAPRREGNSSTLAEPGVPSEEPAGSPSGVGVSTTTERRPLLIYRGQLVLAVFETKQTLDKIEQAAKQLGGYLVERDNKSIVVRVPVAQFEQAITHAALAGDELSRTINVEDVTAQYNDLQIRLRNAQAVRDRLVALLARASSVEEALSVERSLERVTGEIEQMKGKMKLFNELLAYSTVTVRLEPKTSEHLNQRVVLPFAWLPSLGLSTLLYLGHE